jgi:hypothetical protein
LSACGSQQTVVSVAPTAPMTSMCQPESCARRTGILLYLYDSLVFALARAQARAMDPTPAPRRMVCPRCGSSFDCGLSADCWCAAEPYRLPMTKALLEDCLCPACLREAADALAASRHEAEQGR